MNRKLLFSIYKYGDCFNYLKNFKNEDDAKQYLIKNNLTNNYGIKRRVKTSKRYLNKIYNGLKSGFSYSDGFSGIRLHNNCIKYNHFGSSAQPNTIEGLNFILEIIFNDVLDFEKKYKKGFGFVYA